MLLGKSWLGIIPLRIFIILGASTVAAAAACPGRIIGRKTNEIKTALQGKLLQVTTIGEAKRWIVDAR